MLLPGVHIPPVSLREYMGQSVLTLYESLVLTYVEGFAEKAPRLQYQPAAQSAVGSARPSPSQYLPPSN